MAQVVEKSPGPDSGELGPPRLPGVCFSLCGKRKASEFGVSGTPLASHTQSLFTQIFLLCHLPLLLLPCPLQEASCLVRGQEGELLFVTRLGWEGRGLDSRGLDDRWPEPWP